jgi:replication factor C large subunit
MPNPNKENGQNKQNETIPLFEKHRPKKISEVKGQDIAIDKIKAYIHSFEKGISKKKAVLLFGPAGTGKTTLAHVFANEMDYEIFELNASDLRNRAKLDEVLKPSTLQHSLFKKGKIILVDEVDGVTSTEYGGLAELIALIEKTKFPIIITCNDVWQNKFSLLRSKCELIQIKELPYPVVLEIIKTIAKLENAFIPENIIKEISAKSRGDLRAALNDLQTVINLKSAEVMEEQIHLREKSQSIFEAIKEVLKIRTNEKTIEAFENVDMDIDQIILWLEENIPAEYRGEDLAKAFQALSKADVFKGRIHRQQYWHFLIYENFFLTAGVSAAKGLKSFAAKFTKYNPPQRILKIWMANQRNARKKAVAFKLAELTHTSKKRALRDFNILALITTQEEMKEMQLDEEQISFLNERKNEILSEIKSAKKF